ncbi:MAG: 2-amino-4-hydroxy-6-hydroxymethyldihydropteridine diphosphokinase [Pirellulaceae bacterium]|jgi:2-amino-4-hydroxy-6-hydroxymethyldihydropteridine diphosphokinase
MSQCFISLGANLGQRAENIGRAVELLAANPRIHSVRCSSLLETQSVGGPPDQPPFFNAAAELETSLDPESLLRVLQDVEQQLGRTRHQRWDKRTLDLDILLFDDLVIQTQQLTVPHPRMAFRRFVLNPLAEIASNTLHPQLGWTVAEIIQHLDYAPPYIALTGAPGAGKTTIVEAIRREYASLFEVRTEKLAEIDLPKYYDDPTQAGWETELSFLKRRSQLVRDLPAGKYLLTDFWLDQSLAAAEMWLPPQQCGRLAELLDQMQEEVLQPRLIAFVSAPSSKLTSRIQQRGRSYELPLNEFWLTQWQKSLQQLVSTRVRAPILWLDGCDLAWACQELVAASQAIE